MFQQSGYLQLVYVCSSKCSPCDRNTLLCSHTEQRGRKLERDWLRQTYERRRQAAVDWSLIPEVPLISICQQTDASEPSVPLLS